MPRNIRHHRKLFAILRLALDNWPEYDSFKPASEEELLNIMKIEVGHVDYVKDLRGNVSVIPKSISFFEMDQIRFKEFYKKTLDILSGVLGIDGLDIEQNSEDYL